MHSLILAYGIPVARGLGLWGFGALVLLIVFVTLVVGDGPKNKDQ